jgi:uncharacterized protein
VFCGEFEDTLKEAEQGDASAQSILGLFYEKGQGVTQDYKQAVHWYTKAAEQGFAWAQLVLGESYEKGQGVPQNYKLAYVWLSLAAAQGHKSAIKNRDITATKLTPQQLSEAQELANQLFQKLNK